MLQKEARGPGHADAAGQQVDADREFQGYLDAQKVINRRNERRAQKLAWAAVAIGVLCLAFSVGTLIVAYVAHVN